MKEPEVSVIVPVHNSEQYLTEALESLLHQSITDLEILCIEDQSTDRTRTILSECEEKDKRIRVIFDVNSSYGHKINIGIKYALGKYICILESDDIFRRDMVSTLYELAECKGADYVDCDYEAFFDYRGKRYFFLVQKYTIPNLYGRLCTISDREIELQSGPTGAIWTGLYRTDFIRENEISMFESPGAAYQDTSFRFLVSLYSEKSYHLPSCLHQYRVDNAMSSIHDMKKVFQIVEEYDYLKRTLQEKNCFDRWAPIYKEWRKESFQWNLSRLSDESRDRFLKYYNKEFPNETEAFFEGRNDFGVAGFQQLIDFSDNRNVILFGIGRRGHFLADFFARNQMPVLGFCDNNPHKEDMKGIEVLSPEQTSVKYPGAYYVITTKMNGEVMQEQLLKIGIRQDQILIWDK